MENGDIALAELPQADGNKKLRPVLLLKMLPGYRDWLTVGISSQMHQLIDDWDIPLTVREPDFPGTGSKKDSIVRLSFLAFVPTESISGKIGTIDAEKLTKATRRLAEFLLS